MTAEIISPEAFQQAAENTPQPVTQQIPVGVTVRDDSGDEFVAEPGHASYDAIGIFLADAKCNGEGKYDVLVPYRVLSRINYHFPEAPEDAADIDE